MSTTTTTTTATRQPLTIGQAITHTTAGHTITLLRTERVYTVTDYLGTYRVHRMCRSFATEHDARTYAGQLARMYKAMARTAAVAHLN